MSQKTKTVTTRKNMQDAKIKTRAMTKGANRKISLSEAKQRSRQKMVKSSSDNIVQDVYENALSSINFVRGETGVVYDDSFAEHRCLWDSNYPECPERYTSVINRCRDLNLIERCKEIKPRTATKDEILMVHTEEQFAILESTRNCKDEPYLEDLSSNYDAIYIHPTTFDLSLLACGSTIELVDNIIDGSVQNGMAIIRPPGHHAMKAEYNGYCFFNNVAVAAQHAIDNLGIQKILIVDWDVHHGQGTQRAFYNDPRVLYFSIHRFEHGTFWPNLRESDFDYVGEDAGEGKNINVPLNKTGMTNADYLAIFQQLLIPVAIEFQPELILVSAGYDAALGCQEGEMELTPTCYTHLLSALLGLAAGHVAVVLEGGYCLESLSEGAALTLKTLLGDPCPRMKPLEAPCDSIQETILNCIHAHRLYWRNLRLQDVYNIEELNNINPQPNLHKVPVNSFIGGLPISEKFETRDCYPTQSENFKQDIAEKLKKLKLFTNLSVAPTRVCFVYDELMQRHKCTYGTHPEQPERIKKIASRFLEYKIQSRMKQLESRVATEDELRLVHSARHIESMKAIVQEKDLKEAAYQFESVYLHPSTYECATLSAGSILQVVDEVLEGSSRSGVCVVRPPGHHAEADAPCGFCIFNNISIAARYAINNFGLKRVLIVDWDIHHGQGTQHIFDDDPRVLYISLHRFDNGTFFPSGPDADFTQVGSGAGKGFNVNIPWNNGRMGDMEYMRAFQAIILPIAYDFDPELVLVSAGFDAAIGDPLGRYKVSPEAYGHFTHWLSSLAGGKIILALEGGYNVNSISHSMAMCAKSLLGDPLPMIQLPSRWNGIHENALDTIRSVTNQQSEFWKCLKFNKKLPDFGIESSRDQIDLVQELGAMSLNDSDTSGDKKEDGNTTGESSRSSDQGAEAAGPSNASGEKRQTLSDYLAENLEALEKEEMFAVVPKKNCPHLSLLQPDDAPTSFDHNSECSQCFTKIENWICLICFKTFCSRFINEHGSIHAVSSDHPLAQNFSSNHPLALSFSDLSVWCHKCEAYIDNPKLHKFKNLAHLSKFGNELVWSYENPVLMMDAAGDDE